MSTVRCHYCEWLGAAEAALTHCPQCFRWLAEAVHVVPNPATVPADHTFRPAFFEHLGPEGTYVETRRQLKEEAAKRGLISHRLEF